MGFYGNITNTARTQFQFDKIYPNRYTMDKNVYSDGIYVGRYILVEYDQDYKAIDNFIQVYKENDQFFWDEIDEEGNTKQVAITKNKLGTFTFDGQTITPIVYTNEDGSITFYKVTSERDFDNADTKEVPAFESAAVIDNSATNYTNNSTIDKLTYGTDRGYDSTVWMKSYIDGQEKYIMIAELNTVVPTFDVRPDAPSMNPIAPHFDKQSTNVYYPLHWQATWGFRVAAADKPEGWQTEDDNIYKSDVSTSYIKTDYDKETGEATKTTISYPGAIYYNKAGFKRDKRTAITDMVNEISLIPSGISGTKYIDHSAEAKDQFNSYSEQPDMLELSVMLPALGNAVSELWDKVYGYNNTDEIDKEANIGPNERYTNVEYQYPSSLKGISKEGKTFNLNTLAGCINHYHKIILGYQIYKTTKENAESNKTDFYTNKYIIYDKDKEKYYRIHKEIPYEPESGAVLGEAGDEKYSVVEIPGFAQDITTIYSLILDIKQLLANDEDLAKTTKDRNTIQGCINTINDIINLYENSYSNDLIVFDGEKFSAANVTGDDWINYEPNGKDVSFTHTMKTTNINNPTTDLSKGANQLSISIPTFDKAGHVDGQKEVSVNLPNTYTSFSTIGENSITDELELPDNVISGVAAISASDKISINPANKWIRIRMNDKEVSDQDTIQIAHTLSGVDIGEYGSKSIGNNFTDFNIPTISVDEAGHITAAANINITLPNGYQQINVENDSISADSPYDNFTVNGDSKWIEVVKDNDIIKVNHKGPSETKTTFTLESDGSKFTIPIIEYDEKGHYIQGTRKTIERITMAAPDANGQVLTGLILSDAKVLKPSMKNIGELSLVGYTRDTNSGNDIDSDDTVIEAFNKVLNYCNSLEAKIGSLTSNLATANSTISDLQSNLAEAQGKIETNEQNITDLQSQITLINQRLSALDGQ